MWRLRPRAGWLINERISSSGVPNAPPALITVRVRTCQSRPGAVYPAVVFVAAVRKAFASCDAVVGSPARHARPVTRPFSVSTRCTWTPARIRALPSARGR